jgi:hypothetical protein
MSWMASPTSLIVAQIESCVGTETSIHAMDQMEPELGEGTVVEGTPIRSKYRGLSWDKKYQGAQC